MPVTHRQRLFSGRTLNVGAGALLALVVAVGIAPLSAAAQSPSAASRKARPVDFTSDLSFVNTTGNTRVSTLSLNEKVTWRAPLLSLVQTFNIVHGKANGRINSNLIRASLRADRSLPQQVAMFVQTGFDRNPPGGIARRFDQGVGLTWTALASETDRLVFEGGAGATQQLGTNGGIRDFPVARSAGTYRRNFAPKAYLLQAVEVLPNLEDGRDLRVNTESSVVSPLGRNLGVKVTYVVRYDRLPQPDFGTTDRLLTTGLQFTF